LPFKCNLQRYAEVKNLLAQKAYSKATFFPYICHEGPVVSGDCDAPVAAYAECYIASKGDHVKCAKLQKVYMEACGV
jgi:hypothetical protein